LRAIRIGVRWLIPESEVKRVLSGALGYARGHGHSVVETAMLRPLAEAR
jgi:hypothetical protein